jgi:hypothetical protein
MDVDSRDWCDAVFPSKPETIREMTIVCNLAQETLASFSYEGTRITTV